MDRADQDQIVPNVAYVVFMQAPIVKVQNRCLVTTQSRLQQP